MRRTYVVFLTAVAGLGLLLALLAVVTGGSDPTLAAPHSDRASSGPLRDVYLLSDLASITCTLATTTTDGLGTDNSDYDHAATLANYTGLALAPGDKGDVVPPADDWFRLDNAKINSTYEVEVFPDKTKNYNLGIIVYSASLTPIITDTNAADNSAQVTLVADSYGPYFFKVFQISAQCTGETYHLDFSVTSPTATPFPTSTPIPNIDDYEYNDSFNEAYLLPVATSLTLDGLNFYPAGDEDWFKLWVKSGKWYQVTTSDLSGVDTYVEIRDQNNSVVESDDDGGGGYASQATWSASYDGYYYVRLTNKAGSGNYKLKIEEVSAPTGEPTSTPGPTPTNPDADRCDTTELGNHDFDHACVISANKSEEFNFSPPPYGGPDNDFFKVWVKPGLLFECATSNLSAGVDPNMIVYDHNRDAIGGNDDVDAGDYNSYFSYYATYEGWMYVLVGTGDRTPTDLSDSKYTLSCDAQLPGQPTATSTPEPTSTPDSEATPTATPRPQATTPTPAENLTVRPLTTPTPAPATTPAPHFIPISLLIYYDGNDDRQPGAGEGVAGISAQAYEVATNQLLAQGFTDGRGSLEFTVASSGPVRVSVPFFGFSQLVAGEGVSIYLHIPHQSLPGGSP